MYGKIFDSIYDGTLAEDWRALVTFQQFIVLCDADGIVDMTPQAISRRTGIPIDHIKAGIEVLEQADKYSRTPDENGRRIELIDAHRPWGWHIVNHEKYKRTQDADTVRAQTRERVKRHREKKAGVTVSNGDVTDGNAQKRHIDTDTDINTYTSNNICKKNKKFIPPTLQEVQQYLTEKNITCVSANHFLNHYEANGWFRGKTKIKNWKACINTWVTNNQGATNGTHKKTRAQLVNEKLDELAREAFEREGSPGDMDIGDL